MLLFDRYVTPIIGRGPTQVDRRLKQKAEKDIKMLALQKSFDDAQPFKHGMAAVMIDKNWTLLGKQGFQKALPTYNYIENKGIKIIFCNL